MAVPPPLGDAGGDGALLVGHAQGLPASGLLQQEDGHAPEPSPRREVQEGLLGSRSCGGQEGGQSG